MRLFLFFLFLLPALLLLLLALLLLSILLLLFSLLLLLFFVLLLTQQLLDQFSVVPGILHIRSQSQRLV
ncbi:MAG TPA: hypothetical protein EYH03_00155, partial [Chromatiales bacterium]|nr:hypothetical protein [Chromatiales bacterium]